MVSGNTIRLSRNAANTTDLPDNPTAISWGFPSPYNTYNLGSGNVSATYGQGAVPTIDLLTNGVSYFQLSRLSVRKPGSTSTAPQLLTETVDIPVALFGDDLRPTKPGYGKVKVYPPKIVKTGTGIQNNFSIWHASYSSN